MCCSARDARSRLRAARGADRAGAAGVSLAVRGDAAVLARRGASPYGDPLRAIEQRCDRLRQNIEVGANAAAHVTTQGAQAVHAAAAGLFVRETISLKVGPGGYLELLPEPRLLFPGAELVADVRLDCAAAAPVLLYDVDPYRRRPGGRHRPRGHRRLRLGQIGIRRVRNHGAGGATRATLRAFAIPSPRRSARSKGSTAPRACCRDRRASAFALRDAICAPCALALRSPGVGRVRC